jgi:serine/threonine-protein kinase
MSAQPAPSSDEPHPLIGQPLGKYRITRLIGSGGMGAVFEAKHESINQRVAVKVLHAKLTSDADAVKRFMTEAKTTSLVHHVGLVKVHDFGQLDDGSAYMMMEYLEGESLRARLARVVKIEVIEALRITRQIAAALAAAHEKGVVHRDLKPENVLMVPDPETPSGERAKVLDFGIAKVLEPDGEVLKTTTGAILGTPTYMSPEQCRGVGNVTEKADVYSLGAMLYQMIAGRPPFVGQGSGDLIAMHIVEAPQPLRELMPNVSPDVETLVHQMLIKKPDERPSMRQVLLSLEQLGLTATSAAGTQVVIVPPPPAPPARTRSVMLGVALGVVFLGAVAAVLVSSGLGHSADPTPTPPPKVGDGKPPAPAEATPVKLEILSQPPGAQVLGMPNQVPLGLTPWRIERPKDKGSLELLLRMPGFVDQKLLLSAQADETRRVTMIAEPPHPTPVKPAENPKKNAPVKKPNGANKPGKPPGKSSGGDSIDVPIVR